VRLGEGLEVVVGADLDTVAGKLGPARSIVLASRTNLCRLCPERPPVEFLATDHILGIRLASVQAPPLRLRGKGQTMGLRVGMTVQALEGLLGHEYRTCDLPAAGLGYRFYHEHGIAVRLIKGQVAELIIVQVPAA
jgi:hypothetical protein